MVGADFKTVFEIQTVRIGAVVADVDIQVDFCHAGFGTDFAHGFEQLRSIAFQTALRHGHDVVDVDVVTAGQVVGLMETADGDRIVLAFFEDAEQGGIRRGAGAY